MYWALAEYFEAVLIQSVKAEAKKALVGKLRQELVDHIKNEPNVFAR